MNDIEIDYHVEQRPTLSDNEINDFGWLVEQQLFEDCKTDNNVSGQLLDQQYQSRCRHQAANKLVDIATRIANDGEIDPYDIDVLYDNRWELYERS